MNSTSAPCSPSGPASPGGPLGPYKKNNHHKILACYIISFLDLPGTEHRVIKHQNNKTPTQYTTVAYNGKTNIQLNDEAGSKTEDQPKAR